MIEKCNWCGVAHYTTVYPAIAVNGLYFCKMSCRNAYFGRPPNEDVSHTRHELDADVDDDWDAVMGKR